MIINSNNPNTYYVNRTDTISSYLRTINRYPILTADEEKDLIERYQKNKDMSARNKLVNCNQRFIFSAAKRYSNNPDTVMDLVNEGSLGFTQALDRYDVDKGMRLLTFAQAYIRKFMNYYFIYNKIIKRWSDEKLGTKIATERSLYFNDHGFYPTNEELKEIISKKYGKDILDDSIVNDIEYSYIDEFSSCEEENEGRLMGDARFFNSYTASVNDYEEESRKNDIRAIVLAALDRVCRGKEREKTIVKMIYGIDCDREYSVSEIANIYGISETRVNQIRFSVEKKLRENKQFVYLIGA